MTIYGRPEGLHYVCSTSLKGEVYMSGFPINSEMTRGGTGRRRVKIATGCALATTSSDYRSPSGLAMTIYGRPEGLHYACSTSHKGREVYMTGFPIKSG
jgi:hypothetical protein